MQLAPGTRLGPYEILAKVGQGGMGEVYKASDVRLRRAVAIKVLPPGDGTSEQDQTGLVHEARSLAALNHPHIAQVHDAGIVDGLAYIAMEYVDGTPLSILIERAGLSLDTALRYGSEIAGAVAHAHARGIIHRDLKPANVMVTADGVIKVLDFGLARRAAASVDEATRSTSALEQQESVAGTLAYMAPEVLRGQPADSRSDIWSLGVLLYELFAGQRPFAGATAFALSSAVINEPPAALSERVPPGLAKTIHRALSKDRAERYQDAREVQAALDALRPASIVTPARTATPGRSRLLASVAVGAGVILAGLGVWWWAGADPAFELTEQRLLSTFTGAHRMATYSPDGRMVAYVDMSAASPQIWVKNLSSGQPVQITSGRGGSRPVWSRVNDEILFERQRAGIWAVPSSGGAERQVVETGSNPTLTANGATLVFERRGRSGEIWIARADGSDARKLEGVPPPVYDWPQQPSISPDGRLVAYFRAELGPNGDLWVVPTSGGEARRLTFDVKEGASPAWTPDSRFIVFSSARRGSHTLWRIAASGGEPIPVTTGAGSDIEPKLSADGRSLVYTNVKNEWRLRVHDPATGETRTVFSSRAEVLFPKASPTGRQVAYFGRDDHGDIRIFTIGLDGTNVRAMTVAPDEINTMPRWAPDGRSILFYQERPQRQLRRVSVDGGPPSVIAPFSWETHPAVAMSPDGRFIWYQQAGAPTPTALVRDLSSGIETPAKNPLRNARWSRDGRRLVGDLNGAILICPVDTAGCRKLTEGVLPVWVAGDARIVFMRTTSRTEGEVWSIDAGGANLRKIVNVGPFRVIDVTFDATPAGEIVWAEFNQGRHELWQARVR